LSIEEIEDVTITSGERVDDRRNRKYGRWVVVELSAATPAPSDTLRAEIVRAEIVDRRRLHTRVPEWSADFSWRVSALVEAQRPSEILGDEEARAWGEQTLAPAVRSAYLRAVEVARKADHLADLAEQATRIRDHYGAIIAETAAKNVRYKQRTAALRAELEAEKEAVAETVCQAHPEPPEGEPPFHPAAIARGLADALEVARAHGRGLGHAPPAPLQPEDMAKEAS